MRPCKAETPIYELFNKLSNLASDLVAKIEEGLPHVFDPVPEVLHVLHDVDICELLALLRRDGDAPAVESFQGLTLASHRLSLLTHHNRTYYSSCNPPSLRAKESSSDLARPYSFSKTWGNHSGSVAGATCANS